MVTLYTVCATKRFLCQIERWTSLEMWKDTTGGIATNVDSLIKSLGHFLLLVVLSQITALSFDSLVAVI